MARRREPSHRKPSGSPSRARKPQAGTLTIEEFAKQAVEQYGKEWFVYGGAENPFKRAWYLRGFENFLADLCEHPDFVDELLDRLFELVTEQACREAKSGVDAILMQGDIAMQERLIISPDMWRRFFKDRTAKKIIDLLVGVVAHWRDVAVAHGISRDEQERMASAFDHARR